jgi:hypothetical protein
VGPARSGGSAVPIGFDQPNKADVPIVVHVDLHEQHPIRSHADPDMKV